ncbi:MAG: hypothetical protein LBQ70_00545 [Prevotellaceae bacterium]|jgi:hypothetical protein|nr:hypothetical protein [Prevotellaceae bacterium]
MKRIILIPVLFLTISVAVEAAKLKNEIKGLWSVVKIETTDQSLNLMMQNGDFSNLSVEFAKSGAVLLSGKDTGTKYRVEGDKITFSGGMIKEISRPEVKASIKSGVCTINVPADLVKQILLTIRDRYVESGGEAFIAKMIEHAANTYSIEAVVILKRK